jgi:hypothetical protein
MSDSESFISRWSRRKRQTAAQDDAPAADAAPGAEATKPSPDVKQAASEPAGPAFDIESLPPIESITAGTDIRAFLAPGVPPELARAALRRVWTTDPKIRDFVGLADYDWDFNSPGAMAGFGPLEMPDELRRELMRMVGRSLDVSYDAPAEEGGAATAADPATTQIEIESTGESKVALAAAPTEVAPSNDGTSQDDPMSNKNKLYNSLEHSQRPQEIAAPQYDPEKPDDVQLFAKRPHGRALPK